MKRIEAVLQWLDDIAGSAIDAAIYLFRIAVVIVVLVGIVAAALWVVQ